MKQKRLCIASYDSPLNPYYHGGSGAAVHEVAKRLALQYDTTILTIPRRHQEEHATHDGVRYRFVGPVVPSPRASQLVYHATLAPFIRTVQADLIIENFTAPFSTSFLPLFTRIPVIGLAHMIFGHVMDKRFHLPLFSRIERQGMRYYRHIIALTEQSKSVIRAISPSTFVSVIPNGVSLPSSRKSSVPRRDWLYLGRIDFEQKGLDILLDAFTQSKTRAWKLLIAGTGTPSETAKLKQLLADHPRLRDISYIGEVRGKMKQRLFERAGALIISSRYEIMPMVALEAFAHGCPVISSDIPDMHWLPRDTTHFVSLDPRQLAHTMDAVARHPYDASRAARARAFVRQFSWEKTTATYKRLIEATI